MKPTTHIRPLIFIFLTYLLGLQTTYAKTEVAVFGLESSVPAPQMLSSFRVVDNMITSIDNEIDLITNLNRRAKLKNYFSKIKLRIKDLASFMNKSLSDKLAYIDNIWNTRYPIPDMLGGRSFLEDIMGQYRYTQSTGWKHTGDISFNFKGIDFYKGTETGNQIFANTAVSMKTTIQTDVNTWLNYRSIQDNIRFLREGLTPQGLLDPNNAKTIFMSNAEIHIYMPKTNITPSLKTQWLNKLNTDYPDINFEIKAIEDFLN